MREFLTLKKENGVKSALDAIYNGVLAVDMQGHILFANNSAIRMLDLKSEVEVVGNKLADFFPNCHLLEVLNSGKEFLNVKLQTKEKTLIANCSPVFRLKRMIGGVAVMQEISDFEGLAKELQSFNDLLEEFKLIVETSYDGIYVADGDGITDYVNPAYERITGSQSSELLGKNVRELEQKGYFKPSVARLVLEKRERVTVLQQNRNGKQLTATGTPVFDGSGKIRKVVINNRDISEIINLRNQLEETQQLAKRYSTELKRLRQDQRYFNNFVFQSNEMKRIVEAAQIVAESDATVLITGETGVGKEKIAEIIHESSMRCEHPFVKINCAAIPENLLESELFGYGDGAFTGAKRGGKPGLLEVAGKGTILFDEVSEMPLSLQSKLLRVLQEQEYYKINCTTLSIMEARVIAASNKDLKEAVDGKRFREDLYYRLNVLPIAVPPLRERRDDIILLIGYFLEMFNQKYKKTKYISADVQDSLYAYHWPGNVRELSNLIEQLVVLVAKNEITLNDLPAKLKSNTLIEQNDTILVDKVLPLKETLETVEKQLISLALKKNTSLRKSAKELGVNPSTIVRKIRKYHLN